MNDKIYEARKKQAKLKSTPEIEKADNNLMVVIFICLLLSLICCGKAVLH